MKRLIPIFVLIFLLMPTVAFAAPCGTTGPSAAKLCLLLINIRNILWYVGWFIALIVIMIAGIMYMTAGGKQEQVDKAKKWLLYGIIGAAIILASGFILNIIKDLLTGFME